MLLETEPSTLQNVSARGVSGTGEQTNILGFIAGASGGQALVRAVGPTLATFGVANAATNPSLSVFDLNGHKIGQNDDWDGNSDVSRAGTSTGAFALPLGSADAALVLNTETGAHSVHVGGALGDVLTELYEVPNMRMSVRNASSRLAIGDGRTAVLGFSFSGPRAARFLIRAVGPSLLQHGVVGVSINPSVRLYHDGVEVAKNDDWSESQELALIRRVQGTVGAFGLIEGSRDAALAVEARPGVYTAVVSATGASGVALVEVYIVD